MKCTEPLIAGSIQEAFFPDHCAPSITPIDGLATFRLTSVSFSTTSSVSIFADRTDPVNTDNSRHDICRDELEQGEFYSMFHRATALG